MIYLNSGEWWTANLLFGVVFIVASIGIVGIGWFVLRGDRLNREAAGLDRPETAETPAQQGH